MTDELATRPVSYVDGDTALTGALFWHPQQPTPAPAILLVHGGAGLDEHARDQAYRYAELGYTVFACDMYGDGVAGDRARVMACLKELREEPGRLVQRGLAGLAALSGCAEAGDRTAAIGFCFGGMTVLTLARASVRLAGAISIHGSLSTGTPAEPGAVTAKILVCHGAADPHVPMSDVVAFSTEMDNAGADWQLVIYGRAQHGFTHRHAAPGVTPGVAYDPVADERSFTATRAFLADVLAPR
jgi:dienelactone hydrolase